MNMKKFTLLLSFLGFSSLAFAQPAAPTLLSPADGATGVSITPMLDWDTATVDSFYVLVSSQSDLSSPTIMWKGDSTSTYQVMSNLAYSTTYYWTVAGEDMNGMGMFSDTFSFTTEATPLNLPDQPTLKAPVTGALGLSKNPTLEWNAANGATQYRVHIAAYNNFGDTVYHATTTNTSHMVTKTLADYTVYYWRVVAENNDGLSPWSNYWNFTTLYTGITQMSQGNFGMSMYPNPSKGTSNLRFTLKQSGNAQISVVDLSGKEVIAVHSGQLAEGEQNFLINGSELKSGVYFVQVNVNGVAQMMKLAIR